MDDLNDKLDFLKLKKDGNNAHDANNFEKSLKLYDKALRVAKEDAEKATIINNKALVYLKLAEYEKAIEETSKVLDLFPNDHKALYRKCEALECLDKVAEAYAVAKQLIHFYPNKNSQPVLQRLFEKVQKLIAHHADIQVRVTTMFDNAFNVKVEFEKRENALNNILVLTRDTAGCEAVYQFGIVNKVSDLLKIEKNNELCAICIKIMNELCKNEQRAKVIVSNLGVPWFLNFVDCKDPAFVKAAEYCLQSLINSLTGIDNKNIDSKPKQNVCNNNKHEIDAIFTCLINACNNHSISGIARDSVIKLIMRNVHYDTLQWAHKFVKFDGLQRLMEIASEMSEYRYESSMEITDSTRTLIFLCLMRIYESMDCDQARKEYLDDITKYVTEQLLVLDVESKVRITVAITVLLHGPLDIGNNIISREGILEMILVMAGTDDLVQQKVACECIVAAITKQDKAQFILSKGIDILNKLYKAQHESIRVRALVGLCKISSSGGTDASIHPLPDGSNKNLAVACRKFLTTSKDDDSKFWAVEGLSYLTLDAEIKETLVKDGPALTELIKTARLGNMSSVYGVVTTFVNLCNAYEKQEILPEMIELAKFAKRHVPETHEFDKEDYVKQRITLLGKHGTASALVALSKTESDNCKELISRVFNALCSEPNLRGLVVQQGGVKTLLHLSSEENTENGRKQAAQALARIGITVDPRIAFPGERCFEVVRPWLLLLKPECSDLMNFEALLGLCNIASIGSKTCSHILKENGFGKIESYMYVEHTMLRRAAVQCMTNLVTHPDVANVFEGENDKFKFLYLLITDEDAETGKAAAGAVAMLTDSSSKLCDRITSIVKWDDILKQTLANPDKEMQHRGVVIVKNIVENSKTNAEQIMKTDIMEILMALSVITGDEFEKIRLYAKQSLDAAKSFDVIKATHDCHDRSDNEKLSNESE